MTAKLPSIHITHCKILLLIEHTSFARQVLSGRRRQPTASLRFYKGGRAARLRAERVDPEWGGAAHQKVPQMVLHLVTSHSLEGSIGILSGAAPTFDTRNKRRGAQIWWRCSSGGGRGRFLRAAREAMRRSRGGHAGDRSFSGPANHVALEYVSAVKPDVCSHRGFVMSWTGSARGEQKERFGHIHLEWQRNS